MNIYFHSIIALFILYSHSLSAQNYNRYWVFGYDFWNTPPFNSFGVSYLDFSFNPPQIIYDPDHRMNFWGTSASMANSDGQLLFFTNGMTIHGIDHKPVLGGDTIGFGPYWQDRIVEGQLGGMNLRQGCFFLPDPGGDPQRYLLLHSKADFRNPVLFQMSDILVTEIDLINGYPQVSYKDQVIVTDTLTFGKIAVCRHANGRDWWVLTGRKNDNGYYTLRISNEGTSVDTFQRIGTMEIDGTGQAGFASEGEMYYRFEVGFFGDSGAVLNIYDFDRCSGLLSNHRWWYHPALTLVGAAPSPNGRFLYTTDGLFIYQWDLHSDDISTSKLIVAEYDGYVEPGWFPTYFSYMYLGPDGRIYCIPPTGGSMVVHTIEHPDKHGENCEVIQHKLKLPTWNARTTPHAANFRLGPIDGSYCDSLGLDNEPVAFFRFEANENHAHTIEFTDLSYFKPEQWYWEFGDGFIGHQKNEIHTYSQSGTYDACLTVSNSFGSHQFCEEVIVEVVSGLGSIELDSEYVITPNPFDSFIEIKGPEINTISIKLTDINGEVLIYASMTCPCSINTSHLPSGFYIYTLNINDYQFSGKLIKP